VDYACIFGPSTTVATDMGPKRIADVKVGDRVLTQAGDFQRVTATHSFPAIEKPDLIDIEVPWRAGKSHRLTVTLDHKVLVFRDGRNQWVMAGDLRGSDLMYVRRKAAHNKITKVCEWCGGRFSGAARRYCSQACRNAHWASGANPHLGALRSDESRARMSAANRARGAGVTLNRACAERGRMSAPERAVAEWLSGRGVSFERQVQFGEHVVDFFLPGAMTVIEADGAYWHQDQARDVERDRAILAAAPGVQITHLHFFEKRFSPRLDAEPIPGTRYVACNPGPKSFTDPEQFEARPILSLRQWRYGDRKPQKQGAWSARLYDLTVEGVHSFFANGILVSNSHVEWGTGLWGPKHAKYLIVPKKPGGWLSWINPRTGQRVFARKVMHPGSPGAHMFAIGAHLTEAEFEERIAAPVLALWAREQERSNHTHVIVRARV
jgi:very-short-patch-repair endonuclease